MKLFTIISTLIIVIFLSYFYSLPKTSLVKDNIFSPLSKIEKQSLEKNTSVKIDKTEKDSVYLELSTIDKLINKQRYTLKTKKAESPSFFQRALMFNDQLQMWISSLKSIFNRDSSHKSYSAMKC